MQNKVSVFSPLFNMSVQPSSGEDVKFSKDRFDVRKGRLKARVTALLALQERLSQNALDCVHTANDSLKTAETMSELETIARLIRLARSFKR
ncbi:hypothetical protein A2841_01120 [Candidatus Kaiserbacteria bacterium RIFCSPHIGHO2_01_FULL_48_10]|uniref:Uncharacterized protein n=1 Tax=Candidatus Kaiserbacteria bacterium RIFCSPHIGHO2_01_FULL_48_10 TaxID=1798476 RepID=A0A1F6C5V6_9BACT|nr:MAG: hypothetical protein A2841_01120 [Candidatus Kaiserbacteria bacterium RIFCSPHIGHO2_01_FULL_48_10]